MPSKKKKYNSRFPPARIKKIMQSDEEVGKVAQVVPIIISKALEIFVASLLRSSSDVTRSRNARTLTPNHIKVSILSDDQFHFLRDLAQTIPDVNTTGDEEEGDGSMTPAAQMSGPRLQRRISQNKTSTTTSSATATATATTVRSRGRPRKRPIESQNSLSSVREDHEEEEEEEEEEDESEVDEEEADEEYSPQVVSNTSTEPITDNNIKINNNNNNNNSINPMLNSVSNHSSVLTPPESTSSSQLVVPKIPQIDEDDDYDN